MLRLDPYDEETLAKIVERSARLLEIEITHVAAREIARRSRGTPHVANRLLRRVHDYAQVRANGHIDFEIARTALDLLKVDQYGLDDVDQRIMLTLVRKYGGGPAGLNTIATSVGESVEIIAENHEPYLLQLGFLDLTPRGRVATKRAFDYFHITRRSQIAIGFDDPLRPLKTLGSRKIEVKEVVQEDFKRQPTLEQKIYVAGNSGAVETESNPNQRDLSEALRELNAMIGLSSAKQAVTNLTNFVREVAGGIPRYC